MEQVWWKSMLIPQETKKMLIAYWQNVSSQWCFQFVHFPLLLRLSEYSFHCYLYSVCIFRLKLDQLIDGIKKEKYFGTCLAGKTINWNSNLCLMSNLCQNRFSLLQWQNLCSQLNIFEPLFIWLQLCMLSSSRNEDSHMFTVNLVRFFFKEEFDI